MTDDEVLATVSTVKDLMVSVATGGHRIDSVDGEYKGLWRRLNSALAARGLTNPNPHRSLWDWYGRWQQGDLPRWADRRAYVRDLYSRVEDAISGVGDALPEPTGWERVDRQLEGMQRRFTEARTEEDRQGVGLLGREVLISVAQAAYDRNRHPADDGGPAPSETDAKRMLELYIRHELRGGGNEELRAALRAILKTAVALQHDRDATVRSASLTYGMTAAVVDVLNRIQRTA